MVADLETRILGFGYFNNEAHYLKCFKGKGKVVPVLQLSTTP
jgi:hypothetical protein